MRFVLLPKLDLAYFSKLEIFLGDFTQKWKVVDFKLHFEKFFLFSQNPNLENTIFLSKTFH